MDGKAGGYGKSQSEHVMFGEGEDSIKCTLLANHCTPGTARIGKMKVESRITTDKKASSSKSKFAKFKANLPFYKSNVQEQDVNLPIQKELTFKQNLGRQNFAVEGRQLINREERLFALTQKGVGPSKSTLEEEENYEEKLKENFDHFLKKVRSTVESSLEVRTEEEKESLRNAVQAIEQEELQDKRWEGVEARERPQWRPSGCRQTHDSLLQNMVEQRMKEAKLDSNVNMKSSIQADITAQAKQIKEDLLQVAKNVRICYPNENMCQFYAKLYHQVFKAKLMEITDYGLGDEDCKNVLQWVNNHYPSILRHEELIGVVEYEQLEPLLPENVLELLEDQFLTYNENFLQTCCQNALRNEENADPELRDECYISPLASDIIQCVHAVLTSAQQVLDSWLKTQRITKQIYNFFINYQSFLDNVIKDNKPNADAVLKANLCCIREFRNYIMKNPDYIPENTKNDCIRLLTSMRDKCHDNFTMPIHKNLKGKYDKVGSQEWLNHNEIVCSELLEAVHEQIQAIQNLNQACLKELVSQLHVDVLAKYVRKMMKKKIKLKDEKKQHQAATALCANSQEIHTMFTKIGSIMDGLEKVLPNLAELLTLKDPQCIELQLGILSTVYPDLSEAHVSAWLYLKSNLSSADLKNIKKAFSKLCKTSSTERIADSNVQGPLYSSRNFFSKVTIK